MSVGLEGGAIPLFEGSSDLGFEGALDVIHGLLEGEIELLLQSRFAFCKSICEFLVQ